MIKDQCMPSFFLVKVLYINQGNAHRPTPAELRQDTAPVWPQLSGWRSSRPGAGAALGLLVLVDVAFELSSHQPHQDTTQPTF